MQSAACLDPRSWVGTPNGQAWAIAKQNKDWIISLLNSRGTISHASDALRPPSLVVATCTAELMARIAESEETDFGLMALTEVLQWKRSTIVSLLALSIRSCITSGCQTPPCRSIEAEALSSNPFFRPQASPTHMETRVFPIDYSFSIFDASGNVDQARNMLSCDLQYL